MDQGGQTSDLDRTFERTFTAHPGAVNGGDNLCRRPPCLHLASCKERGYLQACSSAVAFHLAQRVRQGLGQLRRFASWLLHRGACSPESVFTRSAHTHAAHRRSCSCDRVILRQAAMACPVSSSRDSKRRPNEPSTGAHGLVRTHGSLSRALGSARRTAVRGERLSRSSGRTQARPGTRTGPPRV